MTTATMADDEKLVKFQLAMALMDMYEEDYEEMKGDPIIVDMVTNIVDKFEKNLKKDQAIPASTFFLEVFEEGLERTDESSALLIHQMRIQEFKSDDPLETERISPFVRIWNNSQWYNLLCHLYEFSKERYEQGEARYETAERVGEAARVIAEKYGFSEVHGEDGKVDPHLKSQRICNDLMLTVGKTMVHNMDEYSTKFAKNIVASLKEKVDKSTPKTVIGDFIEELLCLGVHIIQRRGEAPKIGFLHNGEYCVLKDPNGGYMIVEKTPEIKMYETMVDLMEKLKKEVKKAGPEEEAMDPKEMEKKMAMKNSDNVTA